MPRLLAAGGRGLGALAVLALCLGAPPARSADTAVPDPLATA